MTIAINILRTLLNQLQNLRWLLLLTGLLVAISAYADTKPSNRRWLPYKEWKEQKQRAGTWKEPAKKATSWYEYALGGVLVIAAVVFTAIMRGANGRFVWGNSK